VCVLGSASLAHFFFASEQQEKWGKAKWAWESFAMVEGQVRPNGIEGVDSNIHVQTDCSIVERGLAGRSVLIDRLIN
jgi:hypothetical protein